MNNELLCEKISCSHLSKSFIAEHLGLTTATVSHHMSALLEANLISLEQKNGKIYYHINKDTLSQYINFYEEKLL